MLLIPTILFLLSFTPLFSLDCASNNYTERDSIIGFGLTRKLSRFADRKASNISNMGHLTIGKPRGFGAAEIPILESRSGYFIKEGYSARTTYNHHDDRAFKDEYQDSVYQTAHAIAIGCNFESILDIGCGSGYKLLKYFADFNILGLEIEPALSFLKKTYPDRVWDLTQLDRPPNVGPIDLIIVSDVIEHLLDPDILLNWLQQIPFKVVVICTPERDLIRGVNDWGPPGNWAHVREWNEEEFYHYINVFFNILDHQITSEKGQVIIAIPKK